MRRRTSSLAPLSGLAIFGGGQVSAVAVCAALVAAAPVSVHASTVTTVVEEPTAADLFREGQAMASTADFNAAIEKFEAAMRMVVHDPDAAGIRNRMRTELVNAHIKAYDVDGDGVHLSKADVLLDDYEHELEESQTEEKAWVEERRTELAERRKAEEEAAAAAAAAATPEPEPEPEDPTSDPSPEPNLGQTDTTPVDDGKAKTLMVTGGVLTGVGIVGGVLAMAGFSMANDAVETYREEPNNRDDAAQQNKVGNGMGLAGAITAGVLIPTGVALIVVGAKRKKAAQTAVLPYASPGRYGSAGVVLTGRF